jgi:putative thioredoxin
MFSKTPFDTAGYSYGPTTAAGTAAAPAAPAAPAAAAAPGPADGPLSFDVTEMDFEQAVLERSLDVPVLLDCWAPWCGPCRSLGPVLEKLVQAYGGRFVLAKMNTDEAPQISAALRIRSIPLVVLFAGGRPVDQFVGALPEGQIRAFLDRHLGAAPPAGPEVSPLEELRAAVAQAPDAETAEALLREAVAMLPQETELQLDLADRLVARGALHEAQALADRVPAPARGDRHAALLKRLALAANRPGGDPAALAARILANPRDFQARFDLAAIEASAGNFAAAFEQLLEVVLRHKGKPGPGEPEDAPNWREKARTQLVEWFAVCPDPEVVSSGRRYLGMYLN